MSNMSSFIEAKCTAHSSMNSLWQDQFKTVKEAKSARGKRHIYKRPTWCMWPLNVGTQQQLLLGYVTALGQYQEVIHFEILSNLFLVFMFLHLD